MKVLVIGAAGRIGLVSTLSCLNKGFAVTAFLRTPSKLPDQIRQRANLTIVQGDATSQSALTEAMKGQDAVIQAAIYGSDSPFGTSDSEVVIQAVVAAVKETQALDPGRKALRLWILSGQVLMDIPGLNGRIVGDYLPIHPEHYKNYEFLRQNATDIDWSLLCPAKVFDGEPVGPLVPTIDHVGLWRPLWIIGSIPFIGPLLNIMYNFIHQRLSYKSIGDFLADNLGPGEEMRGKRVGLLEDPNKKTE